MADRPRRLGLMLTDGFALMSYASILEPFRAANQLAGEELYCWTHVSPDGAPVRASSGTSIVADHGVDQPLECDTLFVFAGGDPSAFQHRATFAWLRRIARGGAVVAGVSGGPFLLARAGLLNGHHATIHWEHRTEFAASFPAVLLEPGLYVIDRRRLTCAGGAAGIDLAVEMIAREHGHALAMRVGEWFIRAEPRSADEPQRLGLRDRYGITDDRVLRVLAVMEEAIEEPASRADLARLAGLSVRQLERLFTRNLGMTLASAYRAARLARAHDLLRKTGMATTEIALASGFRSSSQFSRAFRKGYGATPTAARRAHQGGTDH